MYAKHAKRALLEAVTDELDETVQKWMETCEGNFLPI